MLCSVVCYFSLNFVLVFIDFFGGGLGFFVWFFVVAVFGFSLFWFVFAGVLRVFCFFYLFWGFLFVWGFFWGGGGRLTGT